MEESEDIAYDNNSRDGLTYDYTKHPTKFKWLQNCEFYPIDKYLFDGSHIDILLDRIGSGSTTASKSHSTSSIDSDDAANAKPASPL